MEAVSLIILIVVGLVLLRSVFRTPPPHIIYVAVSPKPARGSMGWLLWLIGFFVLLVISGVIKL